MTVIRVVSDASDTRAIRSLTGLLPDGGLQNAVDGGEVANMR